MGDHDDLQVYVAHFADFDVHLGNQRAGCIEHIQSARSGFHANSLRDAVRAEDDGGTRWDFGELFDKNRALGLEVVDDEGVVDDFVAHINRRAVFFQRAFDDGDGAVDASAEAARVGKQNGGRH